jgi:hypothetical protein
VRVGRVLWTFAVVALSAALAVAAASASRTAKPNAQCPNPGQAAAQGGCLVDPWPKDPSKYSAIVAKAAFKHDYDTVWKYLNTTLQGSISQKHWTACQRKYPLSSPGVKIQSVKVADSKPVPVALPPFGQVKLRMVTLQVLFRSPAASGTQAALEYAYWLNSKGKWTAVWLPDTYQLYKTGKCDTSQTRGLY